MWPFPVPARSAARPTEPLFSGGGHDRELTIVRRARVRGMRLSVDPRDGAVRLTLAPRAPLKPALAWAAGKRNWIESELARLPRPVPIRPGMEFTLGDTGVHLIWRQDAPRKPALAGRDPAVLMVGGPVEQFPVRVMRFLRGHALEVLTQETHEIAAQHGIVVSRIGVGDPRARWGSCSSAGDIRYSWRMILAPAFVRRATVAHEVAHRVHMNHGTAFHALATELNGGCPAAARAWLRANGTALHWFGREG